MFGSSKNVRTFASAFAHFFGDCAKKARSLKDLHKQTSSTRSEMATGPLSQGAGGLNSPPVVILGN